ncbi:uncharacterized protein TNCV_1421911 [Trichonephila clavipes]|nr:uncharacterized protein TNCV_1421911 [Trichonephila clavipes]
MSIIHFIHCNTSRTGNSICRACRSVVVAHATYLRLSDRGPRNSSWQWARCTPVVGISLEHHTGDMNQSLRLQGSHLRRQLLFPLRISSEIHCKPLKRQHHERGGGRKRQWYWARTRDNSSHDPIPIPLGYRGHLLMLEKATCFGSRISLYERMTAPFKNDYIHCEKQHQETQRNVSPCEQEEDEREPLPTSAIKDLVKKWEAVRAIVLEWHPNQADVSRVGDLYNYNAINYFRIILKKREKQSTLDMFFNAP